MIVTEVQKKVLLTMVSAVEPKHKPRSSLERLEKKGLVKGNRKNGWRLTDKGLAYIIGVSKASGGWPDNEEKQHR